MKMKTSELKGIALDYCVTLAAGVAIGAPIHLTFAQEFKLMHDAGDLAYSTDWNQGGPIIEREGINLNYTTMIQSAWSATSMNDTQEFGEYGPTPLVAAMRCFVASRRGDEVEIPDELRRTEMENEYPTTTVLTLHLKCALADLIGAYQAHLQGNSNNHDWKAHRLTIDDLANDLGETVNIPEELQ